MSKNQFFNELEVALARPDANDLREHLSTYRRFSCGTSRPEDSDAHIDAIMTVDRHDPDKGLAYLAIAMAEFDDPEFLAVMSAGLLENLLQDPSPEFLGRIVDEARKTERFRWMLGIPFRHAIPDRVWNEIEAYVIPDREGSTLPPAPKA